MTKMTLMPPKQTAEDFIKAAHHRPETPTSYPWEEPRVREDVVKSINLRLTEPYIIKLQWLSEKTHKSQQEIIREMLLPQIEAQIDQLTSR
jgi:hypothetical protein